MGKTATTPDLAAWMQMPFDVLETAKQAAEAAGDAKQALMGVYTSAPVGIWWEPTSGKYAACLDDHRATDDDLELVKAAMIVAGPVTTSHFPNTSGSFIKVAYSSTVNSQAAASFFPGKYANGIPEQPEQVASALVSGLVGAGLGYHTKSASDVNDAKQLDELIAVYGSSRSSDHLLCHFKQASHIVMENPPAIVDVQTDSRLASATIDLSRFIEKKADEDFDRANMPAINVDSLGRTLWQTGANPQLASTTMGALVAAAQMPGGTGDSGWVTPMQMGELAARMGVGYLSGAIVGHTLGLLTGLPESAQDKLKETGEYLGVVQGVLPRLFGRS